MSVHKEVLLFRCEACGVILAPQVTEVADLDRDMLFCLLCMRKRSFQRIHVNYNQTLDRVMLSIEVPPNA